MKLNSNSIIFFKVVYLLTFMGYVELFENKNFESAKQLFLKAELDYREVSKTNFLSLKPALVVLNQFKDCIFIDIIIYTKVFKAIS